MKKSVFIFLLLFYYDLNAQGVTFLDRQDFEIDKTVVVYTIASWCKGNADDFQNIKDTLIKYRSNYKLILLIDTIKTALFDAEQIYKILNPDKVITLSSVFPKRLSVVSENKQYTRYINTFFNTKISRLGPGSLLIVKKWAVFPITLENREKIISEELKEVSK